MAVLYQEHAIFLYQGVAHVPMAIKWTEHGQPRPTVAAAVQLIDVAPTIAAVVGAAPDPQWRGLGRVSSFSGAALS